MPSTFRDLLSTLQERLLDSARFVIQKRQLREIRNLALIVLGALSAAMGLHGFLMPSDFIDGGVTGISMLLAKSTGQSLSVLLPVINFPFIAMGYRQVGLAFAFRSTCAIGLLALMLQVVHFPDVTEDHLLTAVFGGFFIGAGIGLAIRGGAVLDGTEIAALLISKKSHLFRVGDIILAINVVIFFVAMFVLGVEKALFSILTYVSAAKTLDFIIYGIEQYTALTIVSEQSSPIRIRIMDELGRGVTIYKARGGKSGADQEILYCVVTRLEIGKVKAIIFDVDPSAFVVTTSLSDVQGGMVKRSGLH
ncbi:MULTISPECIES: YitT family protein [unclassified Schlesneria]|uniref:YitT family protein n=1 Tax=Schlesneria TaxID=656899 RepID=UPI002F123A6C